MVTSDADSSGQLPDRYKGRPLLILLENYVLSSIGCLPPEKESGLRTIVKRVYGGGDDWKATLRSELHLGDDLDSKLNDMWSRNRVLAAEADAVLVPEEFARLVVDANFSKLLDRRAPGTGE